MILVWMPVYNEQDNLQAAIDSVLAQQYTDFELIISNNHSTDGSADIIAAAAVRDPRIRRISPPRHLPSIEHSRYIGGEILAKIPFRKYSIFIGGHDVWQPNLLQTLFWRAEAARNAAIVYTDSYEIDAADKVLRQWCGWVQCSEIARPFIPHHILLGLTHNLVWGGLWREEYRRQAKIRHACVAVDHLLVAEMALLGEILYQPGSAVFLRQPKRIEEGWKPYVQKHLAAPAGGPPFADFLHQLEWAASLVDKAVDGDPFYGQVALRATLKSSLLGAYICRYCSALNAFEGGFEAFFNQPMVQNLLGLQVNSAEQIAQFQALAAGASPLPGVAQAA